MRRLACYPLLSLAVVAASLTFASPASAHGYISSPPSRQALCASGKVTGCGSIQYEPQSVEGPKGQRNCHAGRTEFAELSNPNKGWPATLVGTSVTFNWVLTARHATHSWEYYIGDSRIAQFVDGGKQPNATVSHQVSLTGYTGRQTVLAIWNIGDTAMAFYNCVDLQIGGATVPQPTPSASKSPTSGPTATASPTRHAATPTGKPSAGPSTQPSARPTGAQPPAQAGAAWRPGQAYRIGDEVGYQGRTYRCRQSHTAINSWEPSYYTLALWLPV